jgi:hypothetical protein
MHQEGLGIVKMSLGAGGQMIGQVF